MNNRNFVPWILVFYAIFLLGCNDQPVQPVNDPEKAIVGLHNNLMAVVAVLQQQAAVNQDVGNRLQALSNDTTSNAVALAELDNKITALRQSLLKINADNIDLRDTNKWPITPPPDKK